MLHVSGAVRMGHSLYCDSHQTRICFQIGAGIRFVPKADAIMTGEVTLLDSTVCDDHAGVL